MKRHAITLLETAVSLISSVTLVAGLASALYVSSRALPSTDNVSRQSSTASKVLCDLTADVSLALSFQERTSRAITFTVPDRNGDNLVETIRYAWSGTAGDPLTYQYNGGTAVNVATNVQSFNLEAITRLLQAQGVSTPVAGNVVFEDFNETKAASSVTSIMLIKPPAAQAGNLLIAAVSLDGNAVGSLAAPAGWNLIHLGPQSGTVVQTFGVWWKLVTASEAADYPFTWSGGRQAYGWIMRFSGHDATNPINAVAATSGTALVTIPSPAVTTSVENAMILRLGGFDGKNMTVDVPGLLGHVAITMDRSSMTVLACSGGGGYVIQPNPGDSGTSAFIMTSSEEYTTVTLAVAPGPAEQ